MIFRGSFENGLLSCEKIKIDGGNVIMTRYRIWKRGTALTAAMVLALTPGLAGCGNTEKADHTKKKNQTQRIHKKKKKQWAAIWRRM